MQLEMKTKKKRKRPIIITLGIAMVLILIFFIFGLNDNISVVHYEIEDPRIQIPVKIAVVADLHSCDYGENQKELISALDKEEPDAIVMVGDIVDDRLSQDKAKEFFENVADRYPCYYVSGNHEFWTGEIDNVKNMIRSYGIEVLEGDCRELEVDNQIIEICGIDDPEIDSQKWLDQLDKAEKATSMSNFTILLSHRPEMVNFYQEHKFDLVLAGHAHGGQWKIPGFLNGVLSPNQGIFGEDGHFFPQYAGGRYDFENQTLIVSRGLAKESTRVPRIYNPPELPIITLK